VKLLLRISVASIALVAGTAALAQHQGHEPHQTEAPKQEAPPVEHEQHAEPAPMPDQPAADHRSMDHAQPTEGHEAEHGVMHGAQPDTHSGHDETPGALGPYPMQREASGTAWQPDSSVHGGLMTASGAWTLMGHGLLNLVYDWQEGPRGDEKAFVSGMLMGSARRPIGNGTVQFRAMVSPDPLMGKSGYPLLLASGETANGVDLLRDRQHPHDFFMELSASISQAVGPDSSVFLYGGLPAAPAFGPPAFMHRESIMASPEAPISHHWLDSTHIAFGVLTGGLVVGKVKAEVSRFNGREPDQHRWNIETGPLDSTAIRLSWNPTRELSLQGSWADLQEPEQLEPEVDQTRWSASGIYTTELAPDLRWSSTLAWGRKTVDGEDYDAFIAESSLRKGLWTVFGRGELTENNELVAADHEHEEEEGHHGPAFRVGKISLGAVRDFELAPHIKLGVGGLYAVNFVPNDLEPLYGGAYPNGAMAFVRLKLD
jgi:hypothetical protein